MRAIPLTITVLLWGKLTVVSGSRLINMKNKSILDELNYCRTDPKGYANVRLKPHLQAFKDWAVIKKEDRNRLMTTTMCERFHRIKITEEDRLKANFRSKKADVKLFSRNRSVRDLHKRKHCSAPFDEDPKNPGKCVCGAPLISVTLRMTKYKKFCAGFVYERNGVIMTTQEGKRAVEEAIRVLKRTKRLSELAMSKYICEAANVHAKDIHMASIGKAGKLKDIGHNGTNGSTFTSRIKEYTSAGLTGENIDYGNYDALDIIETLVVDDGVKDRGHRTNILKGKYKAVGIAWGKCAVNHSRYCCVMDFADRGGLEPNREAHPTAQPALHSRSSGLEPVSRRSEIKTEADLPQFWKLLPINSKANIFKCYVKNAVNVPKKQVFLTYTHMNGDGKHEMKANFIWHADVRTKQGRVVNRRYTFETSYVWSS